MPDVPFHINEIGINIPYNISIFGVCFDTIVIYILRYSTSIINNPVFRMKKLYEFLDTMIVTEKIVFCIDTECTVPDLETSLAGGLLNSTE